MVFPCQNYSDREDSVGRCSYRIWLRNKFRVTVLSGVKPLPTAAPKGGDKRREDTEIFRGEYSVTADTSWYQTTKIYHCTLKTA
jgi:hypothetical protein